MFKSHRSQKHALLRCRAGHKSFDWMDIGGWTQQRIQIAIASRISIHEFRRETGGRERTSGFRIRGGRIRTSVQLISDRARPSRYHVRCSQEAILDHYFVPSHKGWFDDLLGRL